MSSQCFQYSCADGQQVVVKHDPSAVTTGGVTVSRAGGEGESVSNEPAWSYRLWNGSVHLSRYLETLGSALHSVGVIELGSGTGLPSIVLGKSCGVGKVFATDLSHAIPLLSHNIEINTLEKDENSALSPPKPPTVFKCEYATCPANHTLSEVIADCEDYMCNVCDFDIDENSCIHRCVECNFDICLKCFDKMTAGEFDNFPEWFRLHLQSRSSNAGRGAQVASNKVVQPFVFDWGSAESLEELVGAIRLSERQIEYIIGADVTYSIQAIDLFFNAVMDLSTALHRHDFVSSSTTGVILLFAHHNRSDVTNEHVMQQLNVKFPAKYEKIEFQTQASNDVIIDDQDAACTGDMKIYKVYL